MNSKLIIFFFLSFLLSSYAKTDSLLTKDLVINNEVLSFASTDLEINVNSEGEILVTNSDSNTIYLFSKEGKKEKKISREGRGPGEFVGLTDTYLSSSDVLYVLDRNLGKIALFTPPDYEPAKFIQIPPFVDNQIPVAIHGQADSRLWVSFSEQLSIQTPEQKENTLYSVNISGSIEDTVLKYPDDQTFVYTEANSISNMEVPFGYQSKIRKGYNDNLYLGRSDQAYITIFNMDGSITKKIEIEHYSVEIPDEFLSELKKMATSNNTDSKFFIQLLNAGVVPKVQPIYDWFVVDDSERIWVAFNTKDLKNYTLKIYDNKGEKLGETSLSKQVDLQVVRDGYAYGVKKDEEGEQSVIRYKVKNIE